MTIDSWDDGLAYEDYVGRWSRMVAAQFVRWLAVPAGSAWLDFGCGSGALTHAILADGSPRRVIGCDRSAGFVDHARRYTSDARAQFQVATLDNLPRMDEGFDVCVSGLVLNFLPSTVDALGALAACVRRRGTIAAYVWDYAEGIQLMRVFWDAVVALDPAAQALDEGVRFPLCKPDPLRRSFESAGLEDVDVTGIDVPTVFRNFDDYWQPFLGGQGPAPGYVARLPAERREQLRSAIAQRLTSNETGQISLIARAWAIRGSVPADRGMR
jgi:SAM-dependent methyltransferase